MLPINEASLPTDEATLRIALDGYKLALAEHALSVGVPAPWPEYEILRTIMNNGGDFTVVKPAPPPPLTPEEQRIMAIFAIDGKRDAAMLQGVTWNGALWHVDATFQLHITGLVGAFVAGILPPTATVPVRNMANVTMPLGMTEVKSLAAAVLGRVQQVWADSWAAKDLLK